MQEDDIGQHVGVPPRAKPQGLAGSKTLPEEDDIDVFGLKISVKKKSDNNNKKHDANCDIWKHKTRTKVQDPAACLCAPSF